MDFCEFSHDAMLLTSTTNGLEVIGLQGLVKHQDASELALQGRRASPLAVLGPRRDELGHGFGLPPEEPAPGLR